MDRSGECASQPLHLAVLERENLTQEPAPTLVVLVIDAAQASLQYTGGDFPLGVGHFNAAVSKDQGFGHGGLLEKRLLAASWQADKLLRLPGVLVQALTAIN